MAASKYARWLNEGVTMETRGRSAEVIAGSNELDPAGREEDHAKEQPTVLPPLDVGPPVGPALVTDGQVEDLQSEPGRAEEEIEIAKRVEVPEVRPLGGDALVVASPQGLGAAQRVLDGLSQQPGEKQAEDLVPHKVEE